MTKIEWVKNADGTRGQTWNPTVGCTRKSEGCRFCYAEVMARRLKAMGRPEYQDVTNGNGRWSGVVKLVPEHLGKPLERKRPTTYFVDSMSDLFHESLPFEATYQVWSVMAEAYWHTFQVLTKRPARMLEFVDEWLAGRRRSEPLSNVWLGVSVENQQAADERMPLLLRVPAVVRFLSCEPLLGQVRLADAWLYDYATDRRDGCFVDWVIVGGESGPHARPIHPDWARQLRNQCQSAGVSFFFKQHGEWIHPSQAAYMPLLDLHSSNGRHFWSDGSTSYRVRKKQAGRLLDGREWSEMPRQENDQCS